MASMLPHKQTSQQAKIRVLPMGGDNSFALRRTSERMFIMALVVVAVLMLSPSRVVAQQNWTLDKLNPFNLLPKTEMRLPTWRKWATVKMLEVDFVPQWIELPDPADIPAGLSKLHRTTKRNINKTVNSLNPFYAKPPPLVHRPPTGSRNSPASNNAKPTSSSSFWFPSFMAADEADRPSRTVHEFLGRPRFGR
jgi:hypothetical protein